MSTTTATDAPDGTHLHGFTAEDDQIRYLPVEPPIGDVRNFSERVSALERDVAEIKTLVRRGAVSATFDGDLAWEKEFGPEFDKEFPGRTTPRARVERCRRAARKYGLPYATVKAAFSDVWAA